ncbi:MAG: hypothetical protein EOL90_06920 [Spartobacteria bacterium]|nr:hypothetical protein [Spartobacteria bacterium]
MPFICRFLSLKTGGRMEQAGGIFKPFQAIGKLEENWKPEHFSRKTGNTQENRMEKVGSGQRAWLQFRN